MVMEWLGIDRRIDVKNQDGLIHANKCGEEGNYTNYIWRGILINPMS